MRSIALFICVLTAMAASAETLDSLGIRRVNDKDYVEHQVEKGNTLYSLARRYGVTVAEITSSNSGLPNGLQVGQILLIPVKNKPASVRTADKTTEADKPAPEKPKADPPVVIEMDTAKYVYHEVAAGETLAKLGRQYKVSITQLKQWNKLANEALNPGQMVIVGLRSAVKPDPKAKKTVPQKVDPGTETKEEGRATLLNDASIDQQRNFCFHPTAPVGTIIMVTNPANNQSVFVRVQGNYTADGTSVIQLSHAAIKKLGGSSSGFDVSLNYAR